MSDGFGHGILDGGRVHPDVTAQIAAARGRGVPLEPAVRAEMSAALGHDFGDVRVHADPLADSLARSVQARAFTTGADVFFGAGEYAPASAQGRGLLAHAARRPPGRCASPSPATRSSARPSARQARSRSPSSGWRRWSR